MPESKRSKITDEHRQEAARLKALWDDGRPRRTQAVFGEAYGLGNQANVGHYLAARSPLNPKAAAAFASELKCAVADFSPRLAAEIAQLGGGPAARSHSTASAPREAPAENPSDPPDLVIAEYSTGGAMGHGFALEENPPGLIRSWRVTHDWLRLNVPVYTSIENLCIVTGFGPSMKPRYNPGDPLLCDRGVRNVEVDGVYFFRVDGHGFIKQLQRIPTENGLILRAKSFNKDYDPFDITRKMDFEVFGKILTAWRSEQF